MSPLPWWPFINYVTLCLTIMDPPTPLSHIISYWYMLNAYIVTLADTPPQRDVIDVIYEWPLGGYRVTPSLIVTTVIKALTW